MNAEILRMTVEEVNRKFGEVNDDMNIPPDKRKLVLEKNLDEKRKMLLMNLKKGKKKLLIIILFLYCLSSNWMTNDLMTNTIAQN